MEDTVAEPSRRAMLVLLAAALPTAVVVHRLGAVSGGEGGDLRFEVLAVGRRAHDMHAPHARTPLTGVSLIEQTSWPDVVRTSLRVSNIAGWPLLVSPGQFRLRVGELSVMPSGWQHGPGALAAGGTRTGWIDFRTPADEGLFHLEFTPAGQLVPVSVALAGNHGPA